MKNSILYSSKAKIAYRVISFSAIIILLLSDINKCLQLGFLGLKTNSYELMGFVENILFIVLFIFEFIFPHKLEFISIIAFYYSASILLFEPANNMGLLMYFLFITSLYARGYFNRKRSIKNIFFSVLLLILLLSEIRFGYKLFFSVIIERIGFSFVFLCSIFFIQAYISDLFVTATSNKKLNIQDYPKLNRRDAEWLSAIIKGVKYEAIAIDNKMNVGSVKNRFKFIYNELSVGDKRGFINKYSDFEIHYGNEYSSNGTLEQLQSISHYPES